MNDRQGRRAVDKSEFHATAVLTSRKIGPRDLRTITGAYFVSHPVLRSKHCLTLPEIRS